MAWKNVLFAPMAGNLAGEPTNPVVGHRTKLACDRAVTLAREHVIYYNACAVPGRPSNTIFFAAARVPSHPSRLARLLALLRLQKAARPKYAGVFMAEVMADYTDARARREKDLDVSIVISEAGDFRTTWEIIALAMYVLREKTDGRTFDRITLVCETWRAPRVQETAERVFRAWGLDVRKLAVETFDSQQGFLMNHIVWPAYEIAARWKNRQLLDGLYAMHDLATQVALNLKEN